MTNNTVQVPREWLEGIIEMLDDLKKPQPYDEGYSDILYRIQEILNEVDSARSLLISTEGGESK